MRHILWDFNGTLLCDAQLSVDLDNMVFEQLGIPRITLDDYRQHMTMPVRDFYVALGIDLTRTPYETIAQLWLAEFNRQAVGAGLQPGVLDVIDRFTQAGLSQSVLSASYEPSLRSQCDALGLTQRMVAVNGQQDENAEKKTGIARRQLAALGLAPADCLLIGDISSDADLAAEIGMDCVLVSWGHNSLARLEKTGRPIAHTADELAALVLERL